MDERTIYGLRVNMTVDITTMGRKSGKPRRIEIWAHSLDGRLILVSSPGKRSWYANLIANPRFMYHAKGDKHHGVRAVARPITNQDERRAIFARLKSVSQYWDKHMHVIEDWVQGSCLVEVMLTMPTTRG